ncbi:MAG: glycosyltransferase family 2 protein, partial [Candidatus Omnitrophota bacterium]
DDFSDDKTAQIAGQFTDRVVQRRMDIEGKHRNYAYALAKNDWVLSLDADERSTEELGREIGDALRAGSENKAFTIPIRAYLGDYWIRHGGWYPGAKVRLFDKDHFKYEEVEVHPRVFINGPCGHLKSDIVHYSYRDFCDFVRSVDNQTTLEAKKWFNEKRKIGALKAVRKTVDRFIKTFWMKKARKDGMVGFMVAYFNGLYQILSYAKYWQLRVRAENKKEQAAHRSHQSPVTSYQKKIPVTVAIIAKNEEDNITRCLESIRWADDVIVVDGFSTDRTVQIAESYGARVIQHAFSGSFADERNVGMREAKHDWVLHIDADDVVTDEFVSALEDALGKKRQEFAVFKFRRKNYFLDRFMRYGGWHHYIPNLVNRRLAKYDGKVHEVPVTSGKTGIIKADIEHFPFKSVSQFVAKQNRYSTIKSQEMFDLDGPRDERAIQKNMRKKAIRTFWKSYVKKRGFREGFHGFLFSFLFSMIDVLVWAKYWHLCYKAAKSTN